MLRNNKRAMSPLGSTLLLIAFAIGVGAIVMSLGKDLLVTSDITAKDATESQTTPAESAATNVEIATNALEKCYKAGIIKADEYKKAQSAFS